MSAAAPALTVRLGALVALPPVAPKEIVAVAAWFRTNPPVPVHVKFVAVPIFNTVVAARVLIRAMFPEPKAIPRTAEFAEEKLPVLSVKPAKASVPLERSVTDGAVVVNAPARVTVPAGALTKKLETVLPLLVTVAVATTTRARFV